MEQLLQLYQLLKIFFPLENRQQEVQPSFILGRTWIRLPEDRSQRYTLQKTYGNHQRLEYQQEVQTPGVMGSQDKKESSHYTIHRRTSQQDR
ncbi:hypothetical protein O181_003968 [Austropuccinia psidii MF-1]|uniref:Uncharacterized protein n=1 Tax=Austropuccinia psidii MF-1 TaxID=1389203 RepID=A0A9Q3BFF6_9BASI|nr:hypothetical protein [Austropuccinia psidii MF-1]